MSIIISIAIPDGIILAADSRQTQTSRRGGARIGSDFGSKVFQLTNRVGVATFGWAFLQPQNASTLINIGALLEDFRVTINPTLNVSGIAASLSAYFQNIYSYDITTLRWNPTPAGTIAFGFQVVGYNQNSTIGETFLCQIPPGNTTLLRNTNNPGCNWNGQTDVVTRLVLGYDPRIQVLPFFQHIHANPIAGQQNMESQLNTLEYIVNWPTMTMQDAIDFATLMVNSTIKMQRFSDGVVVNPGDVPGCGGEIDIGVITHRDGFRWIQRKELKVRD